MKLLAEVPAVRWIRPAAFREQTGLTEPSYYRLKKCGAIQTSKINGLVFVDRAAFDRALEAELPA